MMFDENDEYLDDPISLVDYEQRRCYYSQDIISLDDDELDRTQFDHYISSYTKNILKLPKSFSYLKRNIELLNECRPMEIKIVDCNQFPWYNEAKSISDDSASDMEDDIIIINQPFRLVDSENVEKTNTHPNLLTEDNVSDSDLNIINIDKLKNEMVKQYDLYRKTLHDYKTNEGFWGNDPIETECNNNQYENRITSPEVNIDEEKQKLETFANVIEKAFDMLKRHENTFSARKIDKTNLSNTASRKEYESNNLTHEHIMSENSTKNDIFYSKNVVGNLISDYNKSNNEENVGKQSSNNFLMAKEMDLNKHVDGEKNVKKINASSVVKTASLIDKNKFLYEHIVRHNNFHDSGLSPYTKTSIMKKNDQCLKNMYNGNKIIPHVHKNAAWSENSATNKRISSSDSISFDLSPSEKKNKLISPASQNESDFNEKIASMEKTSNDKKYNVHNSNDATLMSFTNNNSTNISLDKIQEKKCNKKNKKNTFENHIKPLSNIVRSINNKNANQPESVSSVNFDTILNNSHQKHCHTKDNSAFYNNLFTKIPERSNCRKSQKDYYDGLSSYKANIPVRRSFSDSFPQHCYIDPNAQASLQWPAAINPFYTSMYNNSFEYGYGLPPILNYGTAENYTLGNNMQYSSISRNLPFRENIDFFKPSPPPSSVQTIFEKPNYILGQKNYNSSMNSTMSGHYTNFGYGNLPSDKEKSNNFINANGVQQFKQKLYDTSSLPNKNPNQSYHIDKINCLTPHSSKAQNDMPLLKDILNREFSPIRKDLSFTKTNPSSQLNKPKNLTCSNKGYSQPILPIPTYQKTFEELAQLYTNSMQKISQEASQRKSVQPANKRKATKRSLSTCKISMQEYKKRLVDKS